LPGERRSAIRDVTTLDIDSRSSATEYWRHRLLSLTHLRSGLVRRARIWPRVVSGGRGLVGEAHTQGKSRVSHRPLRQGRHAGRCGAAGARTVRARAVVACASVPYARGTSSAFRASASRGSRKEPEESAISRRLPLRDRMEPDDVRFRRRRPHRGTGSTSTPSISTPTTTRQPLRLAVGGMRWDALAGLGYTIPNDRFFVRDHTGTPSRPRWVSTRPAWRSSMRMFWRKASGRDA
jgi:hypothetical protein